MSAVVADSLPMKQQLLVSMYQFTRRIIGFGVHAGDLDGVVLCRLFNNAISTQGITRYLSSDNDPAFLCHRWQANLRILGVEEIKPLPIHRYLIPSLSD